MNTQTFELQAVTDEDLQAADGGIFGKLVGKGIGKAVKKVVPGVSFSGVAHAGAHEILNGGIEIAKEVGDGE